MAKLAIRSAVLVVAACLFGPASSAAAQSEGPAPARKVGTTADGAPIYRAETVSPVYTIDRIYKSMQGPTAVQTRTLLDDPGDPELLWLLAYEAVVTDPSGEAAKSPEFMCHSATDTSAAVYHQVFPTRMALRGNRVFSVDQGTLAQRLPAGFGIPLMSNQPLLIATQVLNHNFGGEKFDVRQRVSVDFLRHRELEKPLRPLIQHGVFGLVLVEGPDGHIGVDPKAVGPPVEHGPGCSMADDVGDPRGVVIDRFGRRLSSFWVVEPGRHEFHTRVTEFLDLPYDTTVHYAAAHLHPFAQSIELYDLTARRSVMKLSARQREDGIGLADVDSFSSQEGTPLYRGHEYDLIAVYDNTSGVAQDAMATLLLYVEIRDLEFVIDGDSPERPWKRVVPAALPAAGS